MSRQSAGEEVYGKRNGYGARSLRRGELGYRLSLITVINGKARGYNTFAEGWLQNGEAWGRPVDVLVMPDDVLLVSDDLQGVIYRIRFDG